MIDLFFLNKSDVVVIHDEIILNYGGSQGLRDQGLLESAIFQPQMMLLTVLKWLLHTHFIS